MAKASQKSPAIPLRLRDQKLLLKLNTSIVSHLGLEKFLQIICDGMVDLMQVDRAAMFLPGGANSSWHVGATAPALSYTALSNGKTLGIESYPNFTKLLDTSETRLIEDFSAFNLSLEENTFIEQYHYKSCLVLPLHAKYEKVGTLILATTHSYSGFGEKEVWKAQNICDHLALSLYNAIRHRELREKDKLASIALRITRLGYWEYDVAQDCFLFSDELFTMLHTTAEAHGGHKIDPDYYANTFLYPEDAIIVRNELKAVLDSKDPQYSKALEHAVRYSDGGSGYISVEVRAEADENGNIVKVYGTHQDLTKIKQNERHLKDALKNAEESDRLKSAFLANISHEIRTPLNGIMGFATLLNDPLCTEAEREEFAGIIKQSGDRLLNIINDIIDISKIESNLIKFDPQPCKLNDLLEGLVSQHKREAELRGNHLLYLRNPSITDLVVNIDSGRVSQVISNLLNNANKFTESGQITLRCDFRLNQLHFEVEDTGIGIDPKYHHIIFDRFLQADCDPKVFNSGNGLGLSISKGIVTLLGGEISLKSEPGKGSTFQFSFPVEVIRGTNPAKRHPTDSRIQSNRFTVLIAEDEPANFLYLNALLKGYNCDVIHATDGQTAVDIYSRNGNIDLILMDIKMPKLNGLDATRMIRESGSDIPIIAQTAHAMKEDKQRILDSGCNDYITKPIDKDRFSSAINDFIVSNKLHLSKQ